MPNIMKLMKQAAKMQENMKSAQDELAAQVIDYATGGNAVSIKISGSGQIQSIKIAPEVLKDGDVEMLEDLLLSAVQGAQAAAQKTAQDRMNAVTAGLNLPPGLF